MMMKKITPAPDPEAYVLALSGWQRTTVETLRETVRKSARFEEVIKWGHLVYFSDGPAILIRAEESRVLLGFWRGQRLREIEPRLKPGGKYEMATLELHEDSSLAKENLTKLAKKAAALNKSLGNPQADAKR